MGDLVSFNYRLWGVRGLEKGQSIIVMNGAPISLVS